MEEAMPTYVDFLLRRLTLTANDVQYGPVPSLNDSVVAGKFYVSD